MNDRNFRKDLQPSPQPSAQDKPLSPSPSLLDYSQTRQAMHSDLTPSEITLTPLDGTGMHNLQAQSSNLTNPRTRNIADLNETERRVLQHVALVSLYRTRLRHELDLEKLLKFVDGKRSIMDRVAGVFSGRQQAGHEWSRGVPLALHRRLQRITAKWEIVPSLSVTDTPHYIPRILDVLVSTMISSGPEDVWKESYFGLPMYELLRGGQDLENITRASALAENTNFFSDFAQYMFELGIWMDDYGLPFSRVISPTLFENEDHEQKLIFRLLMILIPSPNRDILEVMLLTTLQLTKLPAAVADTFGLYIIRHVVSSVHCSLQPELPEYTCDAVSELFCIPEEAEAILSEPALMEYFSEKGISTRELLHRCSTYLDLHAPDASMIFTSLHFTNSMWSLRTDVADGVAGEQGLDAEGGAAETLVHR